MATAPLAQQRQLLELQSKDLVLSRLSHSLRTLPILGTIAALKAQAEETGRRVVAARTVVSDGSRELTRSETELDAVRSRAQRHEERLKDASTPPKELAAIARELESVRARISTLEAAELELMERQEAANQVLKEAEAAAATLQEQLDKAGADLAGQQADIKKQGQALLAERNAFAANLDAALVALYEQTRRANGGFAVVGLFGRHTEGAPVELNPAELDRIRSAPQDEVVFTDDGTLIVVRMES
ncbi:hypothetical protein ABYF32_02530 [Buchananella felis]|uniref:zinc ribbon domain-containing protein n=1 Tax=Buchananella felis TaxID=3231492 RepID=UPI003528CF72